MVRVVLRLDLFIKQRLPRRPALITQRSNVINSINRQTIPIRAIANRQLKRGVDIALLPVSAHQHVLLPLATIRQAVNQPRVRVEVENARLVVGEDGFPLVCFEAVGMFARVDELEEVDDVDETDLQVGKVLAEQGCGCESLVGGRVAAAGHYDVRLFAFVVRSPFPDSDALCAMRDCLLHGEELEVLLFVGHDDVDVVGAAEAVVHCGEQTVGVRWEVDAYNFRALVCDNVQEAGILMSKAVVILSPDCGCEEDVERSNLLPPFDFEALLDPLAMLVDHGIDDVDERLITVEQTVTT